MQTKESKVPTKEDYAKQLQKLKDECQELVKKSELNADQRANIMKIVVISVADTFNAVLESHIESIRKPAREALREFVLAHKDA